MELLNATGMEAAYTMGMEPSGRELLVVVVKGIFLIPKNGEPPELAEERQPLVMADTFAGEPGFVEIDQEGRIEVHTQLGKLKPYH